MNQGFCGAMRNYTFEHLNLTQSITVKPVETTTSVK